MAGIWCRRKTGNTRIRLTWVPPSEAIRRRSADRVGQSSEGCSSCCCRAAGCPGREWAVRLVICDNQRILAEALAAALTERGHQVLAVTTTVAEGLAAVSAGRPDVCILDLEFRHEPSGLEAARLISRSNPGTKVLILSAAASPTVAINGVAGFIGKDQSVDQIAAALEIIAGGGSFLDPGLTRVPVRDSKRLQQNSPLQELSPREKEIVARIAGGQSTRQMSFAMNITIGTVRTYVKNVLAKFGAHSRLQLAAIVSRDDFGIDLEPAAVAAVAAD